MQQVTMISTENKPKDKRSLFEIAESLQINALNGARRKFLPGYKDETLAVLLERPDFLHYFKNALANEVIEVLTAFDTSIEAVYLYDPIGSRSASRNYYPEVTSVTVQLIAVATTASSALKNFAAALGKALIIILLELPWPTLSGRSSFVDIVIVAKGDVMNGGGYALLLSSNSEYVQKLWERERSLLGIEEG